MKLAAISVDLDEIPCYAAIHGLDVPSGSEHAIYDRALPRLAALFARESVPATFFAIGRDLDREENRTRVRALAESGHEIANHSWRHFYDLTKRPRGEVLEEIAKGGEAIVRATGIAPVGFRAPGYTIDDDVFEVLEELGYTYDSSVFPCPAYYSAKTLAIGAIRARGRQSHSIVDDPRVLIAPADPYRRGHPYWTRGKGLLELPIGVTRDGTGRMPYIGTSVVLSGEAGARVLTEMIAGRPFVNLELHGIDLADADEDGLTWLKPHQPDVRRTARAKEAALESAIRTLRRHGYELVTIAEAARRFA
ncbi:polysaccharide deacetylase family protein [Sandaracinus amylolyticus]|uniref:polysaccharide deacetylase family protein n=1 Tax=Sandaracinus amylolyticus TaxID=927083 RepID=UPI001F020EFA|nr:polysaccharide deacetylase family protein [Sandaracinus amylolyticus]UJR81995.1 Polysaccharide deacetylase [Sandaracinus amylolyticus]